MEKMGKIQNDHQLNITRERLEGAFKMLKSCGTQDVDYAYVQSILFMIVKLQREIIEYLDDKIKQHSQIASTAHTAAHPSPNG